MKFRLIRDGEIVYDGEVDSMRHVRNEVDSIHKDTECGLKFADASIRVEPGDTIECYELIDVPQVIDWDPGF
jgi:translation initiation factor IF-2